STRDTTRPVDDSDYRLEPLAAFVPPDTPLTGIFGENSAGCLANRRGEDLEQAPFRPEPAAAHLLLGCLVSTQSQRPCLRAFNPATTYNCLDGWLELSRESAAEDR